MMANLYPMVDDRLEHDACGIGAIVDPKGLPSHKTVSDALTIVERLAHRAGRDSEGTTGDGVGILTQLPHDLFSRWAGDNGIALGESGDYGVGMFFLPDDAAAEAQAKAAFGEQALSQSMEIIAWRDVPVCPSLLGAGARKTMPAIRQCFIRRPSNVLDSAAFDRRLYVLRRAFEKACPDAFVCSLSCRTIVYKGMMLVPQLRTFYTDLSREDYKSLIALVHSRFSTNTNPSWPKAHPHRMLLHNGEINTIRGNADRMLAREETMRSADLRGSLDTVYPVVNPDGSDSMMLDNTLEFLTMNGFPLPLAGMVLMPEPWQGKREKEPWRDMYRYYSTMMEPWDGPAAILYTDGETVCASLDRNGLRPLRCAETMDGRLILSSEAGILYEESESIIRRWRLKSGGIISVSLKTGEVLEDEQVKMKYAALHPYGAWVNAGIMNMDALPLADVCATRRNQNERRRLLKAFGWAYEDVSDVLIPMAENGKEPIGSMGADEPIAALSNTHPPLFSFFKQRFAQVTNPPIDALREELKTDTAVYIGDDGNLLNPCAENSVVLELPSPVITSEQLDRIRRLRHPAFQLETLSLLYPVGTEISEALRGLFSACEAAYARGTNILVLSDRGLDSLHLAIPSLLAVSALEQYLVQHKKRTAISVVLESGEPRDSHQMALLVAYGARAINPYLAHECIEAHCESGRIHKPAGQAVADYNRALTDGILHIASKMGVSTIQAYQSAQLFEAVGLDADVVDKYFTNTLHRLGGRGLEEIENDVKWHHDRAFDPAANDDTLPSVGRHRLRSGEGAEQHLYSPEIIHMLQSALWNDDYELFEKYSEKLYSEGPATLRGLMEFRFEDCTPVPLEEVESAESIVRRFKTGAMSYGSISQEAHECLADAMNRMGGKSNTGEGGELPERFGTIYNSAIKQVASGRFGVTLDYLRSANEIQIKMAQGAKPGEGGHLPGAKVSETVARTRCSTPGISLISPPPHHDIYSIEDLAQLIYDLKCANENARIAVKLVSSTGVGTIACGVAKAGAQSVLISGGEGGTGAAPLTSIHGAGLPWELGLAEAHQTLCKNNLREMVTLETDGKLMTGRDVAVAILLGAEEFAFATAPLIAMGCRMMRVCNLDTCPFGIATQNEALRKRFKGKSEYVMRFMLFVARQLRGIMARLGAKTVDELVGRGDLLKSRKACPIDINELVGCRANRRFRPERLYDFHLEERADLGSLNEGTRVHNTDRAFGTLLSSRTAQARVICVEGCGGQSFGAFLPKGVELHLKGEANDYLGKGLSGGVIAVFPPESGHWNGGDVLIGNVALYGATGGEAYIAGVAGERFCVRSSGARAVVEGVGDHGCEYMTGGRVAVLGSIGDNFAAGMSGGIAYVLDRDGQLAARLNRSMVEVYDLSDPVFASELKSMLENHLKMTSSPKAKEILEHFDVWLPFFRMVIPTEYRKLLEKEAAQYGKTDRLS
ncbi:MAG: glutamate synthase large subunit [Clostridia bacterium]|nr:glutamate synthase large subunit [Clostridia bacterium]